MKVDINFKAVLPTILDRCYNNGSLPTIDKIKSFCNKCEVIAIDKTKVTIVLNDNGYLKRNKAVLSVKNIIKTY